MLFFHLFCCILEISAFHAKHSTIDRTLIPTSIQHPSQIWYVAVEVRVFGMLGNFLRHQMFDEFLIGENSIEHRENGGRRRPRGAMGELLGEGSAASAGPVEPFGVWFLKDTEFHPARGGGGFKGWRLCRRPIRACMNERVDLTELEGSVCSESLHGRHWFVDTEICFDLAMFDVSASRKWAS